MNRLGFSFCGCMFLFLSITAHAASSCPKGEKRLRPNDECMPARLVDFLFCINNIPGGGRVSVNVQVATDGTRRVVVGGEAEGKTLTIQGSARGSFSKEEVKKLATQIHEVFNAKIAEKCPDPEGKSSSKIAAPLDNPKRKTTVTPRKSSSFQGGPTRTLLSNFGDMPPSTIPGSRGALYCGLAQVEFGESAERGVKCSVYFDATASEWRHFGNGGGAITCSYQCIWSGSP